jgi:hypothetical protein
MWAGPRISIRSNLNPKWLYRLPLLVGGIKDHALLLVAVQNPSTGSEAKVVLGL